jgi:curved DNA-binding protein CbpA
MSKKYYEILEIKENATPSEIRVAYKTQALKWHPDKNPNNIKQAEEKIKKINEAYEILSDEIKRRKYKKGESVSVAKYGYDYGEKVEEAAIGEHIKDLNGLYNELLKPSELISDYHLVRGKRFLQVLLSYYEPIYKKIGWNKFLMDYVMNSVFTGEGLVWMETTRGGWKGNINHFKDLLNNARAKLGLDPLTDQDLQVEGNSQQDSPKITGNNGPDKINGNQEKPKIKNGDNGSNGSDNVSSETKQLQTEGIKNNVQQAISQKNEEGLRKLNELLIRAKVATKYEELKGILQEISKYEGEEFYITQQIKINEARNKLSSLNENKFRNDAVKELQDKLTANGVDEGKLSEEEKNKFNQLKNGEITDVNKINEAVNELSESANKEGAVNRLNELITRAKALVEGKVKGSVDYLQKQAKEVQEGLYSFVYGTNSYQKNACQDRQDDIRLALGQLENHSFHNTNQSDQSGFFRPEVVIPLAGVVILGTIVAIVLVRRKKQLGIKK